MTKSCRQIARQLNSQEPCEVYTSTEEPNKTTFSDHHSSPSSNHSYKPITTGKVKQDQKKLKQMVKQVDIMK